MCRQRGVEEFEGGEVGGAEGARALEVDALQALALAAFAGGAGAGLAGGAADLVVAAILHRKNLQPEESHGAQRF
jgi:hypothetical protein